MNCEGCGAARQSNQVRCLYCNRVWANEMAGIVADGRAPCNAQVLHPHYLSNFNRPILDPKQTAEPRSILR